MEAVLAQGSEHSGCWEGRDKAQWYAKVTLLGRDQRTRTEEYHEVNDTKEGWERTGCSCMGDCSYTAKVLRNLTKMKAA